MTKALALATPTKGDIEADGALSLQIDLSDSPSRRLCRINFRIQAMPVRSTVHLPNVARRRVSARRSSVARMASADQRGLPGIQAIANNHSRRRGAVCRLLPLG
jgi:hypothetical protein